MLKFESVHGYPFHGRTVRYGNKVNPVRKLELVDKGVYAHYRLCYNCLSAITGIRTQNDGLSRSK